MKTSIKTLINQVKKALTTKSSLPESISNSAYATRDGGIVARDMSDNADITIFIGGIIEDMTKCEKLYSKDSLTLAADTGIFNGGIELPENYNSWYEIPEESFEYVVSITAEDVKAAALNISKDKTRRVLTAIHLNNKSSMIESCDGFRAYRKKIAYMNTSSLTSFEQNNGLLIAGRAAAYGLKGEIKVYNGSKYLKLVDECGIVLYVRKMEGQYFDMDAVYERNGYKNKQIATVTIKDKKTFLSVLKTAAATTDGRGRGYISLKVREGFIDYYIKALDIFGSIAADTPETTPDGYYITVNPKYLTDALNQGGQVLEFPRDRNYPMFVKNSEVESLVLPIRGDDGEIFKKFDSELRMKAQREQYDAIKAKYPDEQETPAADPETATPEKAKFLEVPDALTNDLTEEEKEALRRINDRQNAAGRFENITAEDVKKEAEKIAAERQEAATPSEKLEIVKREEIAPEIIKAKEYYRKLTACNFKPTTIQEAETDIIYKQHREKLQPIAKQAGGCFVDTLSIIAAIMAVFED